MQDHVGLLPRILSVNPTELCTRRCVFCPRADPSVFPNRNLNMSLETAERIGAELKSIRFDGRIKISGFGEPLLNKSLEAIVTTFRESAPECDITLITSGDTLTDSRCRKLRQAGLSRFEISLYDGPAQADFFTDMFARADIEDYRLRRRWGSAEEGFGPDESFVVNNRSGLVSIRGEPSRPVEKVCHLPFYKCVLDWDGSVLLCDQDWGRRGVMGNLHTQSLREIWFGEAMMAYRRRLAKGQRTCSPCSTCDIAGDLLGAEPFSNWSKSMAADAAIDNTVEDERAA